MFRRKRFTVSDEVRADLIRLAPPGSVEDLVDYAERKGLFDAVIADESGRWFLADAEDLAEGGVAEFLGTLRATLERLGAPLGTVEAGEHTEARLTVVVDGRVEAIYTTEAESEDAWSVAPVRAFAIVNRRLEAAGSDERLYALYGGNDLNAVFLTERLARAVAAEVDPRDRPYLPLEDDPEGERQRR